MAIEYKRIDADSHVQEKPDTWTSRMSSATWGDRIPHIRQIEGGKDRWFINGEISGNAVANVQGTMPDRLNPNRWIDVPSITYTADGRLRSMDKDGVTAQVLYANIAGAGGGGFMRMGSDFEAACIRAYNDHLTEEFYQVSPDRFIPLTQMPLSNVENAVAELSYNKKRGHRGFAMVAAPEQHGLPAFADRYWDPLWTAAVELGMPANFHNLAGARRLNFGGEPGATPNKSLAYAAVTTFSLQTQIYAGFLLGGVLDRFPGLTFVGAESGIGWVPFCLEAADYEWERCQLWKHGLPRKPSEVFRQQCYVDFWYEQAGLKLRDYIGVDRILWETDFPHVTSIWPAADKWLKWSMEGVPEKEQHMILAENPMRVYGLKSAAPTTSKKAQ